MAIVIHRNKNGPRFILVFSTRNYFIYNVAVVGKLSGSIMAQNTQAELKNIFFK